MFFPVWIKIAGACSLLVVFALAGLAFFSVLHVAMQLQRREIFVKFQTAVFLKVMFASIAGELLNWSNCHCNLCAFTFDITVKTLLCSLKYYFFHCSIG